MKVIKVLIVDDSALIRGLFSDILSGDSEIEVVGTANDPYEAREKIKDLRPDVITLDIEMPKMDGLSFLKKIMTLRPMPVVMVSSLTQKGAESTLHALEIGAVDYVPKTGSQSFDADKLADDLIEKVKAAARARVPCPPHEVVKSKPKPLETSKLDSKKIIAIGASTGGVEALREVITILPADTPPIIITQHMPLQFTGTFAERIDKLSTINVSEAKNGDVLKPGYAYIAPGSHHMVLQKKGASYSCKLEDGELVSGHKPSVDVMFNSVASLVGDRAIGVILTGMGKDGAKGLLTMKKSGAITLGQNESSCVVYGMPKAAYLAGAVDKQVSLNMIASEILNACKSK